MSGLQEGDDRDALPCSGVMPNLVIALALPEQFPTRISQKLFQGLRKILHRYRDGSKLLARKLRCEIFAGNYSAAIGPFAVEIPCTTSSTSTSDGSFKSSRAGRMARIRCRNPSRLSLSVANPVLSLETAYQTEASASQRASTTSFMFCLRSCVSLAGTRPNRYVMCDVSTALALQEASLTKKKAPVARRFCDDASSARLSCC